jgi:hypothetical protein
MPLNKCDPRKKYCLFPSGRGGFPGYAGANTHCRIRSAIKEALMAEFKNVLYPIALTDISPKVVPYVVQMAKQLDAQVHLLHVLRRFDWFVDTYVHVNQNLK